MLIRTSEAVKILGITPQTLRAWVKKGILPEPVQIHQKLWLHNKDAVEKLAEERRSQ